MLRTHFLLAVKEAAQTSHPEPSAPLSVHTLLTWLAQCSKMALEDTGWAQVLTGEAGQVQPHL